MTRGLLKAIVVADTSIGTTMDIRRSAAIWYGNVRKDIVESSLLMAANIAVSRTKSFVKSKYVQVIFFNSIRVL